MWDALNITCLMEDRGMLHLSEYGTVKLNENCSTTFIPSATGKMRHTGTFTAAEVADILSIIRAKVQEAE